MASPPEARPFMRVARYLTPQPTPFLEVPLALVLRESAESSLVFTSRFMSELRMFQSADDQALNPY